MSTTTTSDLNLRRGVRLGLLSRALPGSACLTTTTKRLGLPLQRTAARVVDKRTNAKLKVSFVWPLNLRQPVNPAKSVRAAPAGS